MGGPGAGIFFRPLDVLGHLRPSQAISGQASVAMRILHLVSYSLYSGPMPSTLGLALAQRQLGHQVWLAMDRKRGAFNDYEEAAWPRFEGLGLAPPTPLTLSAKSSVKELWRDYRHLRQLLCTDPPDVLHMHLSHDHTLASLAMPKPSPVVRVRTFHAERSLQPRLGQSWVNRHADGWIVRGEGHRSLLQQTFGMDRHRLQVVEAGVDTEHFRPACPQERLEARARFDLPEDGRVIGHAALISGRGQEELLQACEQLGDTAPWILFVGRGEREPELRAQVQASPVGHRVRFAGYLQGEALLDGYAAMDVAFLGRVGNDASGRPALEAMACGLPVVAIDKGAVVDLVTRNHGYPVPVCSPTAVAAALANLGQRDQVRRKGAAARAWVEANRTFAQEARTTLAFYERLRAGQRLR